MEQLQLNLNRIDRKQVKEIFKRNGDNKIYFGLGEVELKGNKLSISYRGNMGSTIEQSVDPMLEKLGLLPVDNLKNNFTVISEEGGCDYEYLLQLKI